MKKDHRTADWYKAQKRVQSWLRGKGIPTLQAAYYSPYDLTTSTGKRIEVKWSSYRSLNSRFDGWQFNIHRHNGLKESQVDFYVLRMEAEKSWGFGHALHLVLPAPLQTPTLSVSLRSLIKQFSPYIDNVDPLR